MGEWVRGWADKQRRLGWEWEADTEVGGTSSNDDDADADVVRCWLPPTDRWCWHSKRWGGWLAAVGRAGAGEKTQVTP